jgi:exonuclease SbcC
MRPITLTLSGFRSFRAEQTIDFSGLGLFAIIGDTGAGKSSILEAMVYALYNKSTYDERGVKSLIALDADTMRVDFTFAIGDAQYVATRSASRIAGRPALHTFRSLADSEARFHSETTVNSEIVRITKLTYAAFTKTVVLPQGRFAELLTASGSEREPVLTALFSLDEVDRLRESLVGPTTLARERCIGLRAELATYGENPSTALAAEVDRFTEAESGRDRLASLAASCSACVRDRQIDVERKARYMLAKQRIGDLDVAAQRIESLEARYAELRDELAAKNAEHSVASAERTDAAAELARIRNSGLDVEALQHVRDRIRTMGELGAQLSTDEQLLANEEADHHGRRSALDSTMLELVADTAAFAAVEETARNAEAQFADATQRRDVASTNWIALVLARRRLDEARGLAEKINRELPDERGAYDAAIAAARLAEEADVEARLESERAQVANLAATVGASLHAGALCPVCVQTIPAPYEAPRSVDLESARDAEKRARLEHMERNAAVASLRERVAQLEDKYESARRTLTAAVEAEEAAGSVAARCGVDVTAQREPEAMLRFTQEWQSAKSVRDAALERASTARSGLDSKKATVQALQAVVSADRDRLRGRHAAIEEYRERIEATRRSIREEFRPGSAPSVANVEECLLRTNQALTFARAVELRATTSEASYQLADRAVRETEQRIVSEVTAVIDANTIICDTAARVLRDFNLETPLDPVPLRVKSDVESAILWASSVRAWCLVAVESNEAETQAADKRISTKQTEIEALLAGVSAATLSALDAMVHEASASVAVIADRVSTARRNLEKADIASARLNVIEPLLSGLEALSFHLESNRFKKYLTGLREQSLLGTATDILRKMSDGRFAFASGFQILDGQTQLTRDPKTLSGGEKFLASLALALGLVEMTSRAGGQLDALFLDEGFGSLDAAALDAALLELKERADLGKLIGVITHVRGIAAEIEDVIRVQRFPSGSVATKLSVLERDRMMDETLVSGLLEAAG